MENEPIPAGWYDDGHGAIRWWDGTRWTEKVAATPPEQHGAGLEPPAVEPPSSGSPAPGNAAPQQETAPTTPAPARRTGLWIALAVGGVVVAGLVAGAVLLVPSAIDASSDRAPISTPAAPSPTPSEPEQTTPALSEADRAAAVATVQAYNDAWLEADCDGYFASTTEEWQEFLELTDCETFYSSARAWAESIEDYGMEILEVDQVGESAAVSLSETYTSEWDHEGNPLDAPTAFDDRWEYIVIEEDGVWLVDNGFLE